MYKGHQGTNPRPPPQGHLGDDHGEFRMLVVMWTTLQTRLGFRRVPTRVVGGGGWMVQDGPGASVGMIKNHHSIKQKDVLGPGCLGNTPSR